MTTKRARGNVSRSAPRITVVTPSYMSVDTIADCILSVLDQGYENLEYIVVDGGSTDGTVEVIREYEDRLAWWTSERDGGQADALNKGFRRATGDLVCWLNSDDFFYPGALDAAADAYVAAPDAPFYFGNGYRVDRNGAKQSEFFADGVVHFSRDAMVFGLNHVLQPSTFIRRDALGVYPYVQDFAAADPYHSIGHAGNRRVVRNDNRQSSQLTVGTLEHLKHLLSGRIVQRAGRLVAQ